MRVAFEPFAEVHLVHSKHNVLSPQVGKSALRCGVVQHSQAEFASLDNKTEPHIYTIWVIT